MGLQLNDFYSNGAYLKANPDWEADDSNFKSSALIAAIHRHGGDWQTLLDFGCGAGQITFNVATEFPAKEVIGSELSPDALRLAERLSAPNLRFTSRSPFEDDFGPDIVCSLDVFEHVDDAEEFLRRIKDVAPLKIFHVPLELTVLTTLRPNTLSASREAVRHVHFYNRQLAHKTIQDCGMQIVSSEYTSGARQVPNRLLTRIVNPARAVLFKLAPDFAVRLLGGYSLLVVAR